MDLNSRFAFDLCRTRIILAGSGMAGTRIRDNSRVSNVALAGGFLVEFVEDGTTQTGQIFYPTGRPLSVVLDMRAPDMFASLMHNIDCVMMPALRGCPGTFLELADEITHAAYKGKVDLAFDPYIDLPDIQGPWQLSVPARAFIDDLVERDLDLADSYSAFMLSAPATLRSDDPTLNSLIRWNEQVDRWLLEDAGLEHEVIEADGHSWVRMETVPGIVAAARQVGQLEGHIAAGGVKRSPSEVRSRLAGLLSSGPRSLRIQPGYEFYLLRNNDESVAGLACVRTRDLKVKSWSRSPGGVDPDLIMTLIEGLKETSAPRPI